MQPSRTRVSGAVKDAADVPAILGELLTAAWGSQRCRFTEEYPDKSEQFTPTITWHIEHRKSGTPTRQQHHAIALDYFKNPNGGLTVIGNLTETVTYQFDFYGETAAQATRLRIEFEQFIRDIMPLLKERGVDQFVFDEQIRDRIASQRNERLRCRSIRYTAILQIPSARFAGMIERIRLKLYNKIDISEKEPVSRLSGTLVDTLTTTRRVYSVVSVISSTVPEVEYIEGVDYVVTSSSDTTTITWKDNGLKPLDNATYYVTYYYYLAPMEEILAESSQ